MGQGGHVPPIFGLGDITNVPLNISRVLSATFYPCNIFLISFFDNFVAVAWNDPQVLCLDCKRDEIWSDDSQKKIFFSTGCNILRIKSKKAPNYILWGTAGTLFHSCCETLHSSVGSNCKGGKNEGEWEEDSSGGVDWPPWREIDASANSHQSIRTNNRQTLLWRQTNQP